MTATPAVPLEEARLREAHADAAAFFRAQLHGPTGAGPRGYLARRGFAAALDASPWHVGCAPARWTALMDHLRHNGYTDDEIEASGLGVRTRRRTLVDRFRDRLTFGVSDDAGHLVGFVARAAPGAINVPKYLNSPRTPLYDKAALLFGLGEQHAALVAGARPVLVEGPLDALAVALANDNDPSPLVGLASCGTALTATQVARLASIAPGGVTTAFDRDDGGARAAARAYPLLVHAFPTVESVPLPRGSDPAAVLAAHGTGGLRDALTRTVPLVDRIIDDVLAHYDARPAGAEASLCALRELAPSVAAAPPPEMARLAVRLTDRLGLDPRTVTRELSEATSPADDRPRGGGLGGYPQNRPASRALAGVPAYRSSNDAREGRP